MFSGAMDHNQWLPVIFSSTPWRGSLVIHSSKSLAANFFIQMSLDKNIKRVDITKKAGAVIMRVKCVFSIPRADFTFFFSG